MNFFRAISNLLRFDRTDWKALSLFLFAATIFWIFNALNNNYSTNLRFPLQFEFDNTKYIAVEPLPATLTLNVSGNGWEIFRESLGLKIPSIFLPLERPVETRRIIATALSPIVASQIGALQVNFIVTDTLRLKIEPKLTRKVRLKADLSELTFKKDFGQTSPVVILPDSVLLEGPKSFVETFADTIFLKLSGSRINSNFRENVEVVVPHNDLISRNPPVAEVMFEVGPMEEIERYIKLRIPRTPWGIEIDQDSVRCVFVVPQKNRDRFLSEVSNLSATVDLIEIKKGEVKSLLPYSKGIPSYAELIRIDSVKVKKY